MSKLFCGFAFLLVLAAGVAPLYTHKETVDKADASPPLRSYLVMFNEDAPHITTMEKLQDWIKIEIPSAEPKEIGGVWYIEGTLFRGFSAFLSESSLLDVLSHGAVSYVEEDSIMRASQNTIATRPDWGQVRVNQRNLNLATVPAGLYSRNTSLPDGGATTWQWAAGVVNNTVVGTGSNAIVYIMDTGVLETHQEVTGRVRVSRSFITGNTSAADGNGHGTHCAGSAVGRYRGVAPGANLGNLRVLNNQGSGSTANIIDAINWLANASNQYGGSSNTQILSMSLGGGLSTTLNNAVNAAAASNIIPVVAAGNDGSNACNYSPASATEAITVAATENLDAITSWSNYGSCINVFAPGLSIHSSWNTGNTNYNTISGTSMATPLTAGSIAVYGSISGIGVIRTVSSAKAGINTYATRNLVTGVASGTTKYTAANYIVYARWNT